MKDDDPRHGTYAGAVAHWFDNERPCPPCATAETRYRKTRKLKHLRGEAVTVPAIGPLRRIQALHALGWTGPQISAELDVSLATLRSIGYHASTTIHATTARKIEAGYDRLCMTRPVGDYSDRGRRLAARRGWVPPLAWMDIDDPDETPVDWHYKPGTRADAIRDLAAAGAGITEAAARLKIGRKSVEKWCARHNMMDVYHVLASRELSGFCMTSEHIQCAANRCDCSCDCHAEMKVAA